MRFILILLFIYSNVAQAITCKTVQTGTLPIKESSGLAISAKYPGRYYHHNDSGDGPYIYVTNAAGQLQIKMKIVNGNSTDNEDLSLGPCKDKTCLYVGDIGDNSSTRGNIKVTVAEEPDILSANIPMMFKFTFKYPDYAHNAEAMAVHPNGNLYIITKQNQTAGIYFIEKDKMWTNPSEIKILTKIGSFPVTGSTVTGMSISPDGNKFIILTYKYAVEFDVNLANLPLDLTKRKQVGLRNLAQQEAISYLPNGNWFAYSSEKRAQSSAPLMAVTCQ